MYIHSHIILYYVHVHTLYMCTIIHNGSSQNVRKYLNVNVQVHALTGWIRGYGSECIIIGKVDARL